MTEKIPSQHKIHTWTRLVISPFREAFAGNLDAKDRAILGSTENAVLAYSTHFSELILGREDILSLNKKRNIKIINKKLSVQQERLDIPDA